MHNIHELTNTNNPSYMCGNVCISQSTFMPLSATVSPYEGVGAEEFRGINAEGGNAKISFQLALFTMERN